MNWRSLPSHLRWHSVESDRQSLLWFARPEHGDEGAPRLFEELLRAVNQDTITNLSKSTTYGFTPLTQLQLTGSDTFMSHKWQNRRFICSFFFASVSGNHFQYVCWQSNRKYLESREQQRFCFLPNRTWSCHSVEDIGNEQNAKS